VKAKKQHGYQPGDRATSPAALLYTGILRQKSKNGQFAGQSLHSLSTIKQIGGYAELEEIRYHRRQ
jgi:hypothetical protein